MKTQVLDITPAWATDKLESHSRRLSEGSFRQRPIRNRLVVKFAEDMKAGAWQLTHQGIAFDVTGNLLDGQHRLMAVVKSKSTVPMMVTTGLPEKSSMDAMDCGASRSVAVQLQVSHGYSNANSVASIIRSVCQFALDDPKRGTVEYAHLTMSSAIWILESLNFRAGIERALAIAGTSKMKSSYWLSPWLFFWRHDAEKAEEFARHVILLEGLKAGHPALQLHRYLVGVSQRPRRNRCHITRVVAQCLFHFDGGQIIAAASVRPSKEAHSWLLGLDGGKVAGQILKRVCSIANHTDTSKNGK